MVKLENSHSGYAGRTLIQRIEIQMDKRRNKMEAFILEKGWHPIETDVFAASEYAINKGRYEGLAAALAIMRSSSVAEEVLRSNERLGIE
jgi:hypothetical protein